MEWLAQTFSVDLNHLGIWLTWPCLAIILPQPGCLVHVTKSYQVTKSRSVIFCFPDVFESVQNPRSVSSSPLFQIFIKISPYKSAFQLLCLIGWPQCKHYPPMDMTMFGSGTSYFGSNLTACVNKHQKNQVFDHRSP
jgi:hypothetical protein